MEGRVAQHQVQGMRRLFRQAIAGADIRRALAQGRPPVFPGRLHGHIGLVHQGHLGLRVGQGIGDAQHPIAAAEVRRADRRQAARQVREEGAGTDIQALAAEHIGVVDQAQARLLQ
ncbi:hypothetical protein D9M68_711160 [compost metagenome]